MSNIISMGCALASIQKQQEERERAGGTELSGKPSTQNTINRDVGAYMHLGQLYVLREHDLWLLMMLWAVLCVCVYVADVFPYNVLQLSV